MDIRIPLELRVQIPQLGEAEMPDPMVWLKFTCEEAGWTWYIIEMQSLHQDAIFYGYRVGWDEELTYFNQSDLELSSAQWGLIQHAPKRCSEHLFKGVIHHLSGI